jgi:hypothetical protein
MHRADGCRLDVLVATREEFCLMKAFGGVRVPLPCTGVCRCAAYVPLALKKCGI